jgi:hypothetical protein
VALWRQGDRHGATVPLWWLGQNCWNISVYIKDPRAQELPLVGGGEHDYPGGPARPASRPSETGLRNSPAGSRDHHAPVARCSAAVANR